MSPWLVSLSFVQIRLDAEWLARCMQCPEAKVTRVLNPPPYLPESRKVEGRHSSGDIVGEL